MAKKYYGQYEGERIFGETPEEVIQEAGGEMPTEWKQFTGSAWKSFSYSPTQQAAQPAQQQPAQPQQEPVPEGLEQISSEAQIPDYEEPEGGWVYRGEKMYGIPKGQEPQENLEDIFPEISMEEPIPDTFDADKIQEVLQSGLGDLKDTLENIASQPVPETPDLAQQYQDLVESKGLDDLQNSLSDLDEQIKDVKSSYQMGVTDVEGKAIPMKAITGEKRQLQKVYQDQLEPLLMQRKSIQSQIETKQNTIATIMDLEQKDYQNAMTRTNAIYSRKMDQVNSAMKIFDIEYKSTMDAWNMMSEQQQFKYQVKKDQEKTNQALFSTAFEVAQKSGQDWTDMSDDTRSRLDALATASGYPTGSAEFLLSNIPEQSEVITSQVDDNGNLNIITRNPDGTFNTQSFAGIGKSRSGDDGLSLTLAQKRGEVQNRLDNIVTDLQATDSKSEEQKILDSINPKYRQYLIKAPAKDFLGNVQNEEEWTSKDITYSDASVLFNYSPQKETPEGKPKTPAALKNELVNSYKAFKEEKPDTSSNIFKNYIKNQYPQIQESTLNNVVEQVDGSTESDEESKNGFFQNIWSKLKR